MVIKTNVMALTRRQAAIFVLSWSFQTRQVRSAETRTSANVYCCQNGNGGPNHIARCSESLRRASGSLERRLGTRVPRPSVICTSPIILRVAQLDSSSYSNKGEAPINPPSVMRAAWYAEMDTLPLSVSR